MSVTCNFKKFGLGREELEEQVDEGMDPYWYHFDDDPDRDLEDDRTYEERRFDETWECDSSESDEGSDSSPCDEAVELDLREEDWRRQELHNEWLGRL